MCLCVFIISLTAIIHNSKRIMLIILCLEAKNGIIVHCRVMCSSRLCQCAYALINNSIFNMFFPSYPFPLGIALDRQEKIQYVWNLLYEKQFDEWPQHFACAIKISFLQNKKKNMLIFLRTKEFKLKYFSGFFVIATFTNLLANT